MKRFQFRFESLLRLRQQQRRQAELRLDAAHAQLRAATQIVAHLHEQLEQVAQSLVTTPQTATNEHRHLATQKYSARLRAEIDNAATHVRRTEQEVEAAGSVYQSLNVEVERFELLQSQQLEGHRALQQEHLQHDVDQSVLRQWSVLNSETHDA